MSAATWAVCMATQRATIFCNHCRAVLVPDVPLCDALSAKADAEANHHCTPPKPWRPGPAKQ